MDIFTRFNRKNIQDRQIDTLIGLSKGILADGVVNQAEAEFLQTWLVQNCHSKVPILLNLLQKVDSMLEDGFLDSEESQELLQILSKISGESSELGELAKTASLPVNHPMPTITFKGRSFLFTGTCAFGTRKQCQEVVASMGGVNAGGVTRKLDYLVLGSYVSDSWIHESYGRKIEKAMEYRDTGSPIIIVTEDHWATQSGVV